MTARSRMLLAVLVIVAAYLAAIPVVGKAEMTDRLKMLLPILAIVAASLVAMPFVAKAETKRRREKSRSRAAELGLRVRDVVRDAPLYSDQFHFTIEPAPLAEYLLPIRGYPYRWRLLMRPKENARADEDFYQFDIPADAPSSIRRELDRIIADWGDGSGFLELEGTPDGVAAYVEEWGAKEADLIFGYLRSLKA